MHICTVKTNQKSKHYIMKKFILSTIIAVTFVSSSFAKEAYSINYKIKNNFNSAFKDAENVQWTSTDNYVTATFVLDQKGTKAFFQHDGTLIGSAIAISMDALPSNAKRVFAKKYSGSTITEAIKFDKHDGTAYFISAENSSEKLVLQVENGVLSRYKG